MVISCLMKRALLFLKKKVVYCSCYVSELLSVLVVPVVCNDSRVFFCEGGGGKDLW